MAEMLAGVSAGTVTLVLLMAFAAHLIEPGGLPSALAAHRTVPGLLIRPLAIGVGALQGVLGAATGYALLTDRAHALTLAAIACMLLFAGYALYSLYVLRTRPGVPCGCASDGTPMNGWVTGRAAALALASATAAAGAGPATSARGEHAAIVALSSTVFAIAAWLLPAAMADPERSVDG